MDLAATLAEVMNMRLLFSPGDAEDISYRNLRRSPDPRILLVRAQCEQLWREFESFADELSLIEVT